MKRKLNLALWIVAGILAVVFLVSSSTKLFVPKEKLAGMGGAASRWVEDFRPGALKAIGALEFLAAVGLIVPAALGIAPVLVPLAATGAVLLFAGAVIMRLRRGERATIIADLVYLAMAAFVAWGRFGPGSFTRPTQRGVLTGLGHAGWHEEASLAALTRICSPRRRTLISPLPSTGSQPGPEDRSASQRCVSPQRSRVFVVIMTSPRSRAAALSDAGGSGWGGELPGFAGSCLAGASLRAGLAAAAQ